MTRSRVATFASYPVCHGLRALVAALALCAALVAGRCVCAAESGATSHAVIPPNQEGLLSEALMPKAGALPGGLTVVSISIERHTLDLTLTNDDNDRFGPLRVFPTRAAEPDPEDCFQAGRLWLCGFGNEAADWLKAYAAWLVQSGGDVRADGAWTGKAGRKWEGPAPEQRYQAPSAVFTLVWLVLVPLILALRMAAARSRYSAFQRLLWLALLFGFFSLALLFGLALLGIKPPIGLALLWAGLWSAAAAFHIRMRPNWRPSGQWWRAFAFKGPLAFILLALVTVAAIRFVSGAGEGGIIDLKQALLDSPRTRALVYDLYFFLLIACLLALSWIFHIREQGWSRRLAPAILAAVLACIPAAILIASRISEYNPASAWVELQMPYWFARGELPPFSQYLKGSGFLASLPLRLFGQTPFALALIKLGAVVAAALGITLAAYRVHGSPVAAAFAGMLFIAYPVQPYLALEGWWFFLGASFIAMAFALMIVAARRRSAIIMLFALFMAQLAFEVRLEAMVLFVLFFLVQMLYDYPNPRLSKLAVLVFAIDFVRVIAISSGDQQMGGEHMQQNLARYAELLAEIWPWLLVAAAGLYRAMKWTPRAALLLGAWTIGALSIYAVVNTVPSHREAMLIVAPLLVAGSGAVAPWVTRERSMLPRVALVGVLIAAIVLLSLDTRRNYCLRRESEYQLGRDLAQLTDALDKDVPVLMYPTYQSFAMPERPVLIRTYKQIDLEILKQRAFAYPRVACVDITGEAKNCCFYELRLPESDLDGRADKYAMHGCWPAERLGRTIRVLGGEGRVTLLELSREGD